MVLYFPLSKYSICNYSKKIGIVFRLVTTYEVFHVNVRQLKYIEHYDHAKTYLSRPLQVEFNNIIIQ